MKKQLLLGLLVVGVMGGVSTIQAKCHIVSTGIFHSDYNKAKNVCGTCSPAEHDKNGNIRCWCCKNQQVKCKIVNTNVHIDLFIPTKTKPYFRKANYHDINQKVKSVCGKCSPAGYDESGNIRCECCDVQKLEAVVNGFIKGFISDNTDKINH